MNKLIKFLRRFFGLQRCKFYIAYLDSDIRTDLVFACCEAETNNITEESIARCYDCSIENVKILKTLDISQKCAIELIYSMGLGNSYKQEVLSK